MAGALPHRCSRCDKRYTFAKRWDEYLRIRTCACGGTRFYVDKWMLRRGGEQRCDCSGYWFPHRTGSMHCQHNPLSAYHSARDRHGVKGQQLAEIHMDCIWEAEGGRVGAELVPF